MGRAGYGGAYLRVIPEGRTPSAWDPADNVPPFRAIPLPYTGCRSRRIDCSQSRCASKKGQRRNIATDFDDFLFHRK